MITAGVICASSGIIFQNPYLLNTYYSAQQSRYQIRDNSGRCESDSEGWCQTTPYTVPSNGVYMTEFTQYDEKGGYQCTGTTHTVVKDICVTSPCTYCPQNLLTWYCMYPSFWPLWLTISALLLYISLRAVSMIGWAIYPFIAAAANSASKTMVSPMALLTIMCLSSWAEANIQNVTHINNNTSVRFLQQTTFPVCGNARQFGFPAFVGDDQTGRFYHDLSDCIHNYVGTIPTGSTSMLCPENVLEESNLIPDVSFADDGCGVFILNNVTKTLCSTACNGQDNTAIAVRDRPAFPSTCTFLLNNFRGYSGLFWVRTAGFCSQTLPPPRVNYPPDCAGGINLNVNPNGQAIDLRYCPVSSLFSGSMIEITSSQTPTTTPSATLTPTATPTWSSGYSTSTSPTSTSSVTPTTTFRPTPTHTPYPNLGSPLDDDCGIKGSFDHSNNVVMDLTLLSNPPGGNNYGWYRQDDNIVLGYTDGTEGCYGVNVGYESGPSVVHIFCTNVGPSSVTYKILYDASTSDTNNFTDGDYYNADVSLSARLQQGNVPRGSCFDDGTVICKRQCNWWSDCRSGTIGMHANVDNTVLTRSTILQGFDGGDTSSHCVYITNQDMTETYGSRKLSARFGKPITSEILVQITPDHPYVQRNIPTHPNSGLKVYMGGCPPKNDYCKQTYPGPRALSDLTDRSWMFDIDGYFGNQSIDRMYGSAFSTTVSDSKVPTDTCGLDPGGVTEPTVMMTMSDAILNNAITGMLFEPRGKGCDLMLLWGPGCGSWDFVTIHNVCGDYSQWNTVDFNTIGKIPECASLTDNFDRTTYAILLHPLCVSYFPNPLGELITEDFVYDTIRLSCTTALKALEVLIATGQQGSWGVDRADVFLRSGLQHLNMMNLIQYNYNIAGNRRSCPDHNIGMALELQISDLSIIRDFLSRANEDQFNLAKVCGNLLNRDVDGTNKGTIECMAGWRFEYAWSITWPHIIARDHANPPHRFNYGRSSDPVTEYICPAGITIDGCIPPDSDGCNLGRSQNGYWNQLEWETVPGTRLNDLVPPTLYGTSTNIQNGLPISTTFEGISNPLMLQIGERDDEYRKVSSIIAVHDPMACPANVRLLEVDGYIGSGGGSYAHVQFNMSWGGVPAVNGPMYIAVMGQAECVSVIQTQAQSIVSNPGSAIGQEAHSAIRFGDSFANMFIPFTIATPSQTGVADLLICPYYLNDIGNRLACPLTLTMTRLQLPYSVLIIDPPPKVIQVGHVFEEHECLLGICTVSWPFGLGIGALMGIVLAIIVIIVVITVVISCCLVPGVNLSLPKLRTD